MGDGSTRRARLLAIGRSWGPPLAVGVASRVFSIAIIAVAAGTPGAHVNSESGNPFLAWDGWWYVQVAANGYHATPIRPPAEYDVAFFPIWPAIIRVASLGFLSLEWTAIILGNLLFIGAVVLVHRVLAARFGPATALRGAALWAFAPPAYAASIAYAEPVFAILAAAYFLESGAIRQAGFSAAAMLTRLTGLALVPAALLTPGRRWLALVPLLAFAGWWAWLAWMSGEPLMYWKGSPSWYGGDEHGLPALVTTLGDLDFFFVIVLAFLIAVTVGSMRVMRTDLPLGLFALACVGMTVLTAIPESMPRHAWSGFPAFAGLALLAPRWKGAALLALFVIGQGVLGFASIWRGLTP